MSKDVKTKNRVIVLSDGWDTWEDCGDARSDASVMTVTDDAYTRVMEWEEHPKRLEDDDLVNVYRIWDLVDFYEEAMADLAEVKKANQLLDEMKTDDLFNQFIDFDDVWEGCNDDRTVLV